MTGPEHYREAERLVRELTSTNGAIDVGEGSAEVLATAQVHATLALAAAQAGLLADRYIGDGDHITDWNAAACGLAWGGSRSAEGSCDGIALNGVHTQIFNCKQAGERHELHLWRTGLEWFTCRGEAA
ncbi:hypothetical protein ACIOD1_12745 [Streptomyces sp. NPDC088097]|uniref:hypothetical protein n=1 Tax=Streptomyces sp. NPDC088097 TaxID=3365823 RepID=UPI00381DC502